MALHHILDNEYYARIVHYSSGNSIRSCYAWENWTASTTGDQGTNITAAQVKRADFWRSTVGFSTGTWTMSDNNLPVLTGLEGQTGSVPSYIEGGDVATVTIVCVDDAGEELLRQTRTAIVGEQVTITAPTIANYTVSGNETQTVTVAMAGNTVTFSYKVNTGSITIICLDQNNKEIHTEERSAVVGDRVTVDAPVLENYTVVGSESQTVVVTEAGNTVTFTYQEIKEVEELDHPFTDVPANKWYADTVTYVYQNNLFNGTSSTTFSPETNMTRAMFVQALANMEGIDESRYSGSQYSDVSATSVYASAIQWAHTTGVVSGYGDGTFRPNNEVSRQEMAVMIARYVDYKGYQLPNVTRPAQFADMNRVSGWAYDGVELMQRTGIIVGDDAGYFNPQNSTNRAEAATVFMRLHKAIYG